MTVNREAPGSIDWPTLQTLTPDEEDALVTAHNRIVNDIKRQRRRNKR